MVLHLLAKQRVDDAVEDIARLGHGDLLVALQNTSHFSYFVTMLSDLTQGETRYEAQLSTCGAHAF
jgi:hypothetical protein